MCLFPELRILNINNAKLDADPYTAECSELLDEVATLIRLLV